MGGLNEGQSADVPLTVRRVRASSGQGAALFGLSVSGASSFSISTRKSGSDGVKKKKGPSFDVVCVPQRRGKKDNKQLNVFVLVTVYT